MEKSTALGIGLLAVVGVGAYVYLKRKKSTTTTTTTTSSSAVDSSLGLPAVTTTTSVVDTATGATKTTKTDTTSGTAVTTVTNVIDETKTNNYIMAKKISEEIASLQDEINKLELEFTKWSKDFRFRGVGSRTAYINSQRVDMVTKPIYGIKIKMQNLTPQANALGYKILPYGLIEKM
jgi:hypothetical protein